jgi:hypothetical protein
VSEVISTSTWSRLLHDHPKTLVTGHTGKKETATRTHLLQRKKRISHESARPTQVTQLINPKVLVQQSIKFKIVAKGENDFARQME